MDFYDALGENPDDPKIKAARIAYEQVANFFDTLIRIRKEKNITQAKLAQMLDTDQAVISRIENHRNPNLSTIIEYAIALEAEIKLDAKMIQPVNSASFTLTTDATGLAARVKVKSVIK